MPARGRQAQHSPVSPRNRCPSPGRCRSRLPRIANRAVQLHAVDLEEPLRTCSGVSVCARRPRRRPLPQGHGRLLARRRSIDARRQNGRASSIFVPRRLARSCVEEEDVAPFLRTDVSPWGLAVSPRPRGEQAP